MDETPVPISSLPTTSANDVLSRFVVDIAPGLVWSSTPDGSIEFLNQAWADYTGLPTGEIRDWGWISSNLIHADDVRSLVDTWRTLEASPRPGQLEARVKRADGEYRWFLFQAKPDLSSNGAPAKWYGTGIDIQDRRRSEALLDAENQILGMIGKGYPLTSVLDALCRVVEEFSTCSIASILILDPISNRLSIGAAPSLPDTYKLAVDGAPADPTLGSCGAAVHRREQVISADIANDPHWAGFRAVALASGLRACWSSPIISADGTVLGTFAIHSREPRSPSADDHALIDQITHLATISIERTRAREALSRSEAHLAEGQRLSLTGSFSWRPDSDNLWWSAEMYRIYEVEETATPTLELVRGRIHPEDRTMWDDLLSRGSRDGLDFSIEYRLLFPSGAIKHIRVFLRARTTETGELSEYYGVVMDVTERVHAEERIRRNERESREIVDAIPYPISVISISGDVQYANESVLRLFGLTNEEVMSGALIDRMHPEDRAAVRDHVNRAITQPFSFESEYRMQMADGRYRWYLNHFKPMLDEQGGVLRWYVSGVDIDERKQEEERIRSENVALREELDAKHMFEEIVGISPSLRAVLARVDQVARTDSTVLITGETGTGKELVARAIHKRSNRAGRAFVTVNCAAFPPSLVVSELFGHEKGAFTGAVQRRLGRFELAEGGTLFLDEVGELPIETQVLLLRVLQEREFERVGGNDPIRIDVRIIAATNRDLQALIVGGKFRSDLFYRLNVFPIDLPALSDRADDIPLLVEYFVGRYAARAGKRFRGISLKTLELLTSYPWPGNIRELQNVIERSVIVCDTEEFTVDASWLSQQPPLPGAASRKLSTKVADHQKQLIEKALADSKGRVAGPRGAAAKLGMPPSTLDSKIRSLRINKNRFRAD